MTDDEIKELLRPRHERQEWRLAYVAVTRAMHRIYASGAWWYGHPEPTKRPVAPSAMFSMIDGHPVAERAAWCGEPPDRPDTLGFRSELSAPPDPHFAGSWPVAIRSALADPRWASSRAADAGVVSAYDRSVDEYEQMLFDLPGVPELAQEDRPATSATGLVTYAACPKRFHWSEVDRLPRRMSQAARRGVDVHRQIELHHLGIVPLEDLTDDRYDGLERDGLERSSTPGGADPYTVFLESRFATDKPLLVEAPFELSIGPLAVRGRIDAIYADADGWEIVDFKTGRARQDPSLLVQLETYVVAASEIDFLAERPKSLAATFAYLGGGSLEEQRHDIDAAWLGEARSHLEQMAARIVSEDWEPTPGPDCSNCDFLRFCEAGRDHRATQ
jgi:DNA helicase-2/ATP-dependent DNA helicase PcrA